LWGGGDNITIARRGWKRRRSYYMQIMWGWFKNTKKIFYNRVTRNAAIQWMSLKIPLLFYATQIINSFLN
jgi:hypothetical protein